MATNASRKGHEAALHPLICGAVRGEREACAGFLRYVERLAKGYVVRKTSAGTDADDVVQEILISVHKALHTYDTARPCMPWVAAIMHYRLSDWLRSKYNPQQRLNVPLEDVESFLMADVTDDLETREYVGKAVAGLNMNQQAVIQAMYHEDLSVAETSEKLGMSVSSVKVTAHRAYKKLRERLEGE